MYKMAKEMNLFDEEQLCGHDISRAMQKALSIYPPKNWTSLRKYAIRRFYLRPGYNCKKLAQIRTISVWGYFAKRNIF